jgi:surfeit locus 1 family protein
MTAAASARQGYGQHLAFGVLAAAAIVGFSLLGRWQWHRAAEKRVLAQAFAAGMQAAPQALGSRSLASLERYAHVVVHGRYDGSRQFLLDNISRDGRAGYEVLTPFLLNDGRTTVVNRGWLPQPGGGRERLPELALGAAANPVITISARVDELPVSGLASGRAPPTTDDHWPKLSSYPFTPELSAALRQPLEARQLLLDATESDGYRRDWQPASVGFGPERHLSYAVQWWSLALLTLVIYVYMFVRSQRD